MSYTPSTRLDSKPRGGWTRQAIEAEARRRGALRWDDLMDVFDVYFGQAFLNPEIVAIQSAHETGWWTSPWYRDRLNLAGIGITGDPTQNNASKTWTNGRDAARAHLTHLWRYLKGTTPPATFPGTPAEDPRWDAAAAYAGKMQTIGSLTNTWAKDSAYDQKLVNILNQRPADEPPGDGGNDGGALMGYQKVRFVGLDRDVWLPDTVKVSIEIVPASITNVRSNQRFTGQTKTTYHDTGSPGSRARSERNYLHSGAGGRAVGYNFAVDDREIIQLTPLNEVTWAAGTAEGNRISWHVEQCFGGDIAFEKSVANAIALHAGLCAAKGWSVDTALVPHQYWFGKWCPGQLLNQGRWPEVQRRVAEAARAIRAGGTPAATISAGDICAATVSLNIRAEPATGASVLYTLAAGQETLIRRAAPVEAGGYRWQPVQSTTEKGEIVGWAAEAGASGPYLVVTKDAETPDDGGGDEPPVTYPPPLAIAELAPYVGRPIVPMPYRIDLADGGAAFPVYDRVRAVKDTPRRREATGDERVGPDIAKGLEFDVSFLVLKVGQPDTYVTPYWTRVTAEDVEIISDAPRDIEPAAGEAA